MTEELKSTSAELGESVKPPSVKAIGIMLLIGAVVALTIGILAASTVVLLLWPGTYFSFALAVSAAAKGLKLLGKDAASEPPPKTTALLQIANIMVLDIVNVALGITILILSNSPEVTDYLRTKSTPEAT